MHRPRHLALYLLCIAVLAGFAALAYHLLHQHATAGNIIVLAVLAYTTLRVLYEFTINRRHVPTLTSGAVMGGAMAAVVAEEAARHTRPLTVVDLGSGRGGLTQRIARAVPTATVIGVERSTIPHWQAHITQRIFGPRNLRYVQGDLLQYNCHTADAVAMYLGGTIITLAADKLLAELRPGTLVISCEFRLPPAWGEPEIRTVHTPFKRNIFIYRTPPRV
jgi:hypothetical protein